MTFSLAAGKLRITRSDGIAVFDSDDKLFHVTDTVTGTVSIPVLTSGSGVSVNSVTTYNLGAVTSFATQVIGAVKFVLTVGTAGLAYNRWHMVMGGTIVWVMDGEEGIVSTFGQNFGPPRQYVGYNFDISGGQCRLVRTAALRGIPSTAYAVRAHDIEYKLKCGVWV